MTARAMVVLDDASGREGAAAAARLVEYGHPPRVLERALETAVASHAEHLVLVSLPSESGARDSEQRVASLGVPFTIVVPAFFRDSLLAPPTVASLRRGSLALPLAPEERVQVVGADELAAFVALVLEQRAAFVNRRVEIASDELSGTCMAMALSRSTRSVIRFAPTESPAPRVRRARADIVALRRDHPEVGWRTFEEWTKTLKEGTLS